MTAYQYDRENTPPRAIKVTDGAITRFDHVYEVALELMQEHITQQSFPNWDTLRIVHSRAAYLAWMHSHWAGKIVSGEELLREVIAEQVFASGDI